MMTLLQNALYVPEDDLYLVSHHRHDFKCHKLRDGKEIGVDGGLEYARRVGNLFELDEADRYTECCLTSDQPFEGYITDKLLWGSSGKDGKGLIVYRPIKEWAEKEGGEDHLRSILKNVSNLSLLHRKVVEYWLAKLEARRAGEG